MSQADLFGPAPQREVYVPKQEHVLNRLRSLAEELEEVAAWPWDRSKIKLQRETVWPYLCGLVADPDEAARWRARLEASATRLDKAS
jgi:hypothetical protein